MLSPLILCPSLLVFAAGSGPPALEQEVQEAIQAAARQTFHGRIQFHQEALFPPRPELADEAAAFDPDRVSETSSPEHDAWLRQTYGKIHESMLEHARNSHVNKYDLAVTLGPGGAIRLDRYHGAACPSTTTLAGGEVWRCYAGGPYLTTCDADALNDPQTVPAQDLKQTIGEARSLADLFVNQRMRSEFADAVQGVETLKSGEVVARLSTPEGPMTIRFSRVAGKLRVATITKPRNGRILHTTYDRYVPAGDAWLAQRVEYTVRPAGSDYPAGVDRRTIREITQITPIEVLGGADAFARPDPCDPAHAGLMYENDVTVADIPMIPLRDDVPELETAEGQE